MNKEPKHIIVIGTPAGGLAILNELVSQQYPAWDAAYLIVLHLSRKGISDFFGAQAAAFYQPALRNGLRFFAH